MSYQCEIVERRAQPTLAVRATVSVEAMPGLLGHAYGSIMEYLGEQGQFPAGAPFAAFYNMDMQALDVEAGFPVITPLPDKGDVKASAIPGGKYASVIHTGPYDQCPPAYEALTQFLAANKLESTGVSYELYLNDPEETPAQELRTQILFPLK